MARLPYEKIAAIRKSITRLDGLVAVFSQRDGPQLLHVYVDPPADVLADGVRVIALDDLPNQDLSAFDGPLVGFSALDVVRDDLLTKGPAFCPLAHLFPEEEHRLTLGQTMAGLADYLASQLAHWPAQRSAAVRHRAQAKVIQMALWALRRGPQTENLVAVVPDPDLARFVSEAAGEWIYADPQQPLNLDSLPGLSLDAARDWVVALEELSLFHAGIRADEDSFIELRKMLPSACLHDTRRELAYTCHARSATDPRFLPVAVALMAEYWLADEDVEDLVALCPHEDWSRFAETGDALRVYRVPVEGDKWAERLPVRPGPRLSLKELLDKGLPGGYRRFMLSFGAVRSCTPASGEVLLLDLGSVLWKAGHEQVLARTLWLLSRDLLEIVPGEEEWGRPHVSFDQVVDLAVRAGMIYSLGDPWTWRQGRWELYLDGSFRNLQYLLEQSAWREGKPLSSYYAALRHWYGCWSARDVEAEIENMLTHLREFRRAAGEWPAPGLEPYRQRARCLIDVGEAVLHLKVGTGKIEPNGVQSTGEVTCWRTSLLEVVREVTRESSQGAILSRLFSHPWSTLLAARVKRQHLQSQERDVDRLVGQLKRLSEELKRTRQLVCAPAHERAVLDFAYGQEIDQLEGLLQGLETAAKLTINLANPWLDLHEELTLTLEVTNLGRVEAANLGIILVQPKGFQLVEDTPSREIPLVPPGATSRVRYRIRPERLDAEIRLEYSFRDRRRQLHRDAWTARLPVRSLPDEEPFRVKVNRYQFGTPIQNPVDFYGRRTELQNILSHLRAGGKQNILVRAPRRMGKTSLLYMLKHALTDTPTRRLFDIPPEWDAELDRVHPVFLSWHSFELQNGVVLPGQFFRILLERTADTLALDATGRAPLLQAFAAREKEVGAVNAALEQMDRILVARPGERIVVLLDEYDEVYRPGSGSLDRNLREFVSAEQRLTWIIASTLALFKEVKSVSSPWFNVFAIVELGRLTKAAASALVETPSQDEVTWRSDALLSLLDETGYHPAFVQLFCGRVIEYLNEARSNYVQPDTISAVADQIVDEQQTAQSHFEFYWSDTGGVGQLILLLLDDHDTPLKRDEIRRLVLSRLTETFGDRPRRRVTNPFGDRVEWRDEEFRSWMDWVEKIVSAVSPDDQRRYVFTVPLFRRWLRRRRRHEDLLRDTLDKIGKEMERDGLADG